MPNKDAIVIQLDSARLAKPELAAPGLIHAVLDECTDAVVCINAAHQILYANQAADQLLNKGTTLADDQTLFDIAQIQARSGDPSIASAVSNAIENHQRTRLHDCTIRFGQETEVKIADITIKPFSGAEDHPLALVLLNDKTETAALTSAAAHAESTLNMARDTGRFGVWLWYPQTDKLEERGFLTSVLGHDESRRPTNSNELFERVHPADRKTIVDAVRKYFRGESSVIEVEHRNRDAAGNYRWTLARGKAIEFDVNGRVSCFLGTHIDIEVQKRAQLELAESHRLLDLAMHGARQGMWDWRPETGQLTVSDSWNELFKTAQPKTLPTPNDPDYRLHPDDVAATHESLLRVLKGESASHEIEHRLLNDEGEYRWVLVRGVVAERGRDGRAKRVIGTHTDITDLKEAQAAQRHTEEILELALESGQQGAWEWDPRSDTFVSYGYWTQGLVFGDGRATPTGQSLMDNTHPDDVSNVRHALVAHLRGQCDQYETEQRLRHEDGSYRRFLVRGKIVARDKDGNPTRVCGTHTDISSQYANAQALRIAGEANRQGLFEWNPVTHEVLFLSSWLTVFGYDEADLTAQKEKLDELIHPDDRENNMREAMRVLRGEKDHHLEIRVRNKKGEYVWVLARGTVVERDINNRATRVIGSHLDISAIKRAQASAADSRQFLELVLDTIPDRVFWKDRESRYLGCNRNYAQDAGISDPRAITGMTDDELPWGANAEVYRADDAELLSGTSDRIDAERPFVNSQGDRRILSTKKVPLKDPAGNIIGVLGTFNDITESKRAEQEIERLAFYDPLTNLPNRRYLLDRLHASLSSTTRRSSYGAVLFIDLDQFKNINDSLGHSTGDSLLVQIAQRLSSVVRTEDTVARLGGDEFVVLLPELTHDLSTSTQQTRYVADKVHAELAESYAIAGHEFHVTPTIGITLFPGTAKSVDDVLKQADAAMYRGKAAGRNVTRFYDPSMRTLADDRLEMESALRVALKEEQFELHYQPLFDGQQRMFGCEALLRWERPGRGQVPPTAFIRVAEECGLIQQLGDWVLRTALQQLGEFQRACPDHFEHVSINVSAYQFRTRDFVQQLEAILVNTGADPRAVVLEVTEGTVSENIDQTVAKMERLRALGVRFSVDDFGVGYSSLASLMRLPLQQLKIDRSFVRDIDNDPGDKIIIETILSMGRHLGMQIIAEGVETDTQLSFLRDRDCDGFQGYFFSHPLPADELIKRCRSGL